MFGKRFGGSLFQFHYLQFFGQYFYNFAFLNA